MEGNAVNDEAKLTVVEQREVTFYGDELIAVRAADGQIYVTLPSMCKSLGLSIQAQARRIGRHEVLASGYTKLAIMASLGEQRRHMGVLRADLVPLWLSGLSVNSVRPEMREKITRYQREAAKVLWEAFQEGRLTADPTFDELLASDSPAAQAYKMATAIMRMAQQQLLLEARVDDHSRRIETLEETVGDPGQFITPDQATQISQAVKAVAMVMTKRSGSSQYGAVYGEMYRKFRIPSYKQLPASKFQEAMSWLTDWYRQVTAGDDVPF
jgi:hypothetical protein